MGTEAGAVECPVCGEGFREPPARCFRCESDLSLWWPLDGSLRALCQVATPLAAAGLDETVSREWARARSRWKKRAKGWVVPVLLLGGLGGALWLHLESTRPPADGPSGARPAQARALPATRAKPAPMPTPRRTLRYVVQPGDSLWRIAAALKGDPRRWPELLAQGEGVDPARLRPGQELRLVIEP